MSFSRSDRVALVLAGTRGLGLASAEALAAQGHAVAVCGRTADDVESAAKLLGKHGGTLGIVADVGDACQMQDAVDQVRAKLGRVRVLVGNAGGPPAGGFDDVSSEDWDFAYRLMLRSFIDAVTMVLPDMRAVGWGRVLVIGSSSIRRPLPRLVLSNTFRPALNGLVKDLAVTLAPERITVNVVAPGRIDTDRVRQLDAAAAERQELTIEQVRKASEGTIPMGRYGEPSELAALLAFLASEEAGYITGQSILVDGGLTASLP